MKLLLVAETDEEREALGQGAVPAPVLEMALGMTSSRVMMAAVELGIIDSLAEAPATSEGLAARLGLDLDGTDIALRVLESFGLVGFGARGWMPLQRAQWLSVEPLADLVRFNRIQWDLISDLEDRLAGRGEDLHDQKHTPEFWGRYLRALAVTAGETCAEVAQKLPLDGAFRVLDVGGGHGGYAAALCDVHPGANATVLDLEDAVGPGEALCGHERVSFVAGDLRTESWGEGYDLILLFNVTPHLDETELPAALSRARAALRPGGVMALMQPRRQMNRGVDAQLEATGDLLFWLASARRPWGRDRLETWLTEAGFAAVEAVHLETAPRSLLLIGRA